MDLEQVKELLTNFNAITAVLEKILNKESANPESTESKAPKETKRYYKDNKLHREDGPAVEYPNGYKEYYINDKLHREDGPAVECANGDKFYYIDNKLHREDGPAVERANGDKFYYIGGTKYTREEYLKLPIIIDTMIKKFSDQI